jgi:type IX secretion system PorP/SprF family membrane protein
MRKQYFFLLFLLPFLAVSQQDAQFTQFMYNRIYYNPAVAGTGGAICFTGFHRSQWVGFEGAPVTQNINGNIPIRAIGGGVGFSIVNDQIGFFNNISAELNYAYQLQLSQGTLGIGLGFSFMNNNLDLGTSQWTTPDGDGLVGGNDFALAANGANGLIFDLDFGVYYNSQNLWAGVSTTRVIENRTAVDSEIGNSVETFFRNARHYYVMGGYNWAIPGTNWELQPSTLVKVAPGAALMADINVTGVYNKKIWGGVTYRIQDAIGTMVGYQVSPALRAGYSYDIATSDLAGEGGGSHEIFMQYCFKIEIPPREKGSYKNPRFL